MPIRYDMPLWRPPSEGRNLIIQATIGCSYNQCSFCSNYYSKQFRARPLDDVKRDIDIAADEWPDADRVFLADGDAMVLPTEQLLAILAHLAQRLPDLARVSSYATPDNIIRKSPEDLRALKAARLSLVYVGIESGHGEVLKRIAKGASPKGIGRAITRARDAGIKVSAMVILGLGGREFSDQHIDATIELVNAAPPNFLSTLQLDLSRAEEPGFLARWAKGGSPFDPIDDNAALMEMARLVEGIAPPSPIVFRTNHASNALPVGGTLPKDKERILQAVALAHSTGLGMRPRFLRGA